MDIEVYLENLIRNHTMALVVIVVVGAPLLRVGATWLGRVVARVTRR